MPHADSSPSTQPIRAAHIKPDKRKTVALVLGSGSSRGWAHIGAIEALEAEGIPIDYISSCSIGAYVGALYAAGSLAGLKDFVLSMDGKKVFSYFDVTFPRSGLLDGTKKLAELFSMHTSVERFSELRIPLIAVDLNSGIASRRMRKTPREPAPGKEPRFKNELLAKLSDYYASAGNSFKQRIHVLLGRETDMPDIIDTVMTSINIMQERITRINLAVEPPDVLVQPRLGALKMMDFDQVQLCIEEGYIGMMEKMEDIKAMLDMPVTSTTDFFAVHT